MNRPRRPAALDDVQVGVDRLEDRRRLDYLTVRRFDAAIADLERAAALVEGQPDEVEPDRPGARRDRAAAVGG